MKKQVYLLTIFIMAMATTGWCDDKTAYSASSIAVDGIASYYSSMADLKSLNQPEENTTNYKEICGYLNQNRETVISKIAASGCYDNLGRAVQMVDMLYKTQHTYHAYTRTAPVKATAPGYFDAATGHRYYKSSADTYAEFARKGEFLKTVPSDQPLLTKSGNIHPLTPDNYILYEKTVQGETEYMALPGLDDHPKGWKADKILMSLN